jgi:hypothetical protein
VTDYTELDRLAEALIELNKANLLDWAATIEDARIGKTHTEYALAANPAVVRTLIDELDQARNGMKYACAMRLKKEIDRLQAENVALRKDADRYRWTSIEGNWVARMFGKWRAHTGEYGDAQPTAWYPSREEAIDAAMSKEPQP